MQSIGSIQNGDQHVQVGSLRRSRNLS